MSGSGRLDELSVLIVEDDYYLATDAQEALEGAGAQVIGPFPDPAQAIAALALRKPDCALVDINLGGGPNFETARALRSRGVPVIFVTGYDGEVIPSDLADAPRLEKPTNHRRLVGAVAGLCGRS